MIQWVSLVRPQDHVINLTIKGTTRPVVLDVDGLSPEIRDPWGSARRGASATATINRKDFGLTWNKTMDNGGMVVAEEVAIQLEVEFVKNQSAPCLAVPTEAPSNGGAFYVNSRELI